MMYKIILLLLCLLPAALIAEVREAVFYEVRAAAKAPVLDGKLDDPCWQNAQIHTKYYQYGKPNPKESPLKTEFRALYTADGLYVAIVNYDDQIQLLRKAVVENDNINLWRDDCAELYIDPEANGIGHSIFTINALGVKGDRRRLDTAVYLWDWNGNNWLTSASIEKDRWVLELFFPWEDLGKKAAPGDLWQFLHARYAWKNKFIGAASAAGADYRTTEKFGYLFFSGKDELSSQNIAEILYGKIQVPCVLLNGKNLIRFNDSGTRIEPMEKVLSDAWREYSLLLAEVKALHDGKLPASCLKTVKKCSELTGNKSLAAYQQLTRASEELARLKWEYYLNLNFNLPKGK